MTIKIEYFSDVLCIWAYSGQVRMDELKCEFGEQIEIEYRFVPIFGAGKQH
ncbi:MAG: disulfide bond formation protein DsbA, partial [Gammaproteobacteria bacterium]|nr:disulfide bond formation protein DsbA [Gammaproteobacteria bacterium]